MSPSMEQEEKDSDVYRLVTELSEHILGTDYKEFDNPCFPQRINVIAVKSLRSKAFAILLNKTDKVCGIQEVPNSNTIDPITELLKYAFTLRVNKKHISKATDLECTLEKLTKHTCTDTVIHSTMQLLIGLKNTCKDVVPELDIFHYDKENPVLPEILQMPRAVPQFQTYPIESFTSSNKFELMLKIQKQDDTKNNISINSSGSLLFISKFNHDPDPNNGCARYGYLIQDSITSIPIHIVDCYTHNSHGISFFSSAAMKMTNNREECFWMPRMNKVTASFNLPHVPFGITTKSISEIEKLPDHNFPMDFEYGINHSVDVWYKLDAEDSAVLSQKTWESFGKVEFSTQTLFMTDTQNVPFHLERIKQISILTLLPQDDIRMYPFFTSSKDKEFVDDLKLLLFGIESNSFKYSNIIGFSLQGSVIGHGMNIEAMSIICQEPVHWGNSYKFLTRLVIPNFETDKVQRRGLIFKAMCKSIRELLLYYRAALVRIFANEIESTSCLKLLNKVRPIATTIVEVAKLCQHNRQNESILREGTGILTLIYKEVSKVTKASIALVLYSILKSCCEVYFRFLQRWLFEGFCEDIYGEFMIKVRPQYLRTRDHKFWTKSYSICHESVPGFLSGLTELILQCGKTVKLLRICDPKNPICNIFTALRPEMKVCLSVATLREQLSICQEYERVSLAALNPLISLPVAIQNQKNIEKETAVIAERVQQNTLIGANSVKTHGQREKMQGGKNSRLNLSINNVGVKGKELDMTIVKKEEVYKVEKEGEEEGEGGGDEGIGKEREEVREGREIGTHCTISNRMDLLNYYEELTTKIKMRQTRSNWRMRRMSHFDERINVLLAVATTQEYSDNDLLHLSKENATTFESIVEYTKGTDNISHNANVIELQPLQECNMEGDENSNVAKNEIRVYERTLDDNIQRNKNFLNRNTSVHDSALNKNSSSVSTTYKRNNERSVLQDFLREEAIKELHLLDKKTTVGRPKFLNFAKTHNATEAQNNKLKLLQQKYGMTPNNNELNIMFLNKEDNQNRNFMNKEYCTFRYHDKCDAESDAIKGNEENGNVYRSHESGAILLETLSSVCNSTNLRQSNINTPMSCTTDHFTSSTRSTPVMSQLQAYDNQINSMPLDRFEKLLPHEQEESNAEMVCQRDKPRFAYLLNPLTPPTDTTSSSSTFSLTVADVETIDHTSLQVYLEKSIIIPLQTQSRLVNSAIIKYFLNEHNMLLHLHSLRSYFFLLNGEFAKNLTDSLYTRLYEISVPIELFNSATLTNLLERALVNSYSFGYVHSELLSLSAINIPLQLQISNPAALDCLCLHYKISWPLNIIFDDTMMLQYSKVFKFLLMIGRVSWVLQEDFNIMKIERKAVLSEQYHKLQLYRHSMTQFMNALHNYLTCSVLHSSWTEFEKELENCMTIDHIYLSHVNYIKRILSRCMLNARGEKMRTCLYNLFKIILKFHNRLRSESWKRMDRSNVYYIHPNFKRLEQMYQAFCDLRTYMAHVAFKLATSGYQPHLMHFLNALNINHMYDLTIKSR